MRRLNFSSYQSTYQNGYKCNISKMERTTICNSISSIYKRMDYSVFRFLFLGIIVGCFVGSNLILFSYRLDCLVNRSEGKGAKFFPSLLVRNDEERFLFVGIMTVRHHINTRAKASYLTWVQEIPGRVVYFVGDGEPYEGEYIFFQNYQILWSSPSIGSSHLARLYLSSRKSTLSDEKKKKSDIIIRFFVDLG